MNISDEIKEQIETLHLDENNLPHCEDGPAIIWKDGQKWYFKHGEPHNLEGPARVFSTKSNQPQQFFIDGVRIPVKNMEEFRAHKLKAFK